MINLCPICESGNYTYSDGKCYCEDCGNVWPREPEPIVRTFPYPIGTILYETNWHNGKVRGADKYEVTGYRFDERGTWATLIPRSFDGIWTNYRLPMTKLYLTEKEALEA